MPARRQPKGGRGSRRAGDAEPDLFSQQLAQVVAQAFEATATAAEGSDERLAVDIVAVGPVSEGVATEAGSLAIPEEIAVAKLNPHPVGPAPAADLEVAGVDLEEGSEETAGATLEVLPARMLNEFVYCPRLFYYEHVEGVFVESADTVLGASVHQRVDKGSGAMPKAKRGKTKEAAKETGEQSEGPGAAAGAVAAEPEEIHSRSVSLGSERLGVVAKMDLVETTLDQGGAVEAVQPVDYKVGAPREGDAGRELWDADKMQLGLQCLILRDNGYPCRSGIIYYRATKQRVPLEVTPELETWVEERIAAARTVAAGPIPPPLVDSPKCVRCSLAPVCLPDETHWLAMHPEPAGQAAPGPGSTSTGVRRSVAARDERRALYLNTQGFRVGCNDAVLKVKEKDRLVEEVRVMDVCHVALFGNIQVSTQAVQRLCDSDVPVTWFSMGGWFYGMTRGHSLKNVLVRIEQFRHAADPVACLRLARQFVRGKIHNHRVLFMRNHVEPPERIRLRLGQAREDALAAGSLEALLGIEGAAAAEYFKEFAGLLRGPEADEIPDVPKPEPEAPWARFDFRGRNRRPPTDPVNALLSLAYSLLAKECTLAAYAVGLDPYVGFYHQPRHGRPALALDIMEEFRPLIAESAVITAINNRFVSPRDFVTAGRAVNLSPAGRKLFFQCFEQRVNSLITHPLFDYKVSYRRAIELQFRVLARVLTGEIAEYVPFMTR